MTLKWVDEWLREEHGVQLGVDEPMSAEAIEASRLEQLALRTMRAFLIITDTSKAVVRYYPTTGEEMYIFQSVRPYLPADREFILPSRAIIEDVTNYSTIVSVTRGGVPRFRAVRFYMKL